jgi:hypothetical protein
MSSPLADHRRRDTELNRLLLDAEGELREVEEAIRKLRAELAPEDFAQALRAAGLGSLEGRPEVHGGERAQGSETESVRQGTPTASRPAAAASGDEPAARTARAVAAPEGLTRDVVKEVAARLRELRERGSPTSPRSRSSPSLPSAPGAADRRLRTP